MKIKCGYKNCKYKDHLIEVNNSTMDNIIYYGGEYYHSECFIRYCKNDVKNELSNLEKYREEAVKRLSKKKHNKIKKEKTTMADVYQFIRENYGLSSIPRKITFKLKQIFDGTLPEVPDSGISKEDFLDMWKRKINKLIIAREKAVVRGISMDAEREVLYDITVLVSKYNSYLKWKEEHNSYSSEPEDPTVITTRDFLQHYIPPKEEEEKKEGINILDMVNEILGY